MSVKFELEHSESQDSDEDYDPYAFMPITKLRALYDYSYRDDYGNVVTMIQGEEYHLINQSGDWWEVVRDAGDIEDLSFYVPANYVQIIDEKSDKKSDNQENNSGNNTSFDNSGDLSSNNTTPEKDSIQNGRQDLNNMENSDFDRGVTFERKQSTTLSTFGSKTNNALSEGLLDSKSLRRSFSDEGEYVNLDKYRTQAGLSSERHDGTTEEDLYANLQQLHNPDTNLQPTPENTHATTPDSPPPISNANYLKTLLGIWDTYLDPVNNRLFYVNKETSESTYKPPRAPDKAKQSAALDRRKISAPDVQIKVTEDPAVPSGWRVEDSGAGKIYVNTSTNEKWASKENEDGNMYYYKIGGLESAWSLPQVFGQSGEDPGSPPPSAPPTRSPQRSPNLARSVKARSMVIGNKINLAHHYPPAFSASSNVPKSQTLPANLSTPSLTETSPQETRNATLAPQMQEGLSGTIKVAKIMEAGKPKKKSSNQSYVKLSGSNLVFYKDLRASRSQPGSPHGRPEFIVPLQGGVVEKNPKEFATKANKKNVIKLSTNHSDQYLLQFDEDIMLHTWLIQLDKTIKSLGTSHIETGTPTNNLQVEEDSSKIKKKPSFKFRKGSSNKEDEGTSIEKKRLKDKLKIFVTNRPKKEQLEQKGIIKDAVFGAHLKQLCEREKGKIPRFVQKCVVAIEKKGLHHDGLYRISGNLAQIQKLRCQVDQDHYNLEDEHWDVHVLTGTLKLFFRELKEPLFTYNLFDKFIPALSKEKNTDRLKAVKELIITLPKHNYETMKYLMSHLVKVIENSKENRMQAHNVAIVFGPTLIWPETVTPNLAANMIYQSRIVEYCLLEYKNIFR